MHQQVELLGKGGVEVVTRPLRVGPVDHADRALEPRRHRHGIAVEWQDFAHPVYPQLHGEFVPYLSALDLLLNCGPRSGQVLAGAGRRTNAIDVEQEQQQ